MKTFTKFLLAVFIFATPALAADEQNNLFTLSYAEAEKAVSAQLADKGAAEKVAALMNGRANETLYSYGKPLTVEARGVQFDKTSGRWSANLLISAEGKVVTAMPSAGRFDVLTEIPVLKRSVKRGELITAQDIEIRDIAVGQVRADTVTDIASLIGKSPAYSITAGRPMREHEIAVPAMIKKNALVQMHYRSPGMEITTSAQAMEDGRKGEVISVKNLASKKLVQALVEDSASVSVASQPEKRMEISVKPTFGDVYAATN